MNGLRIHVPLWMDLKGICQEAWHKWLCTMSFCLYDFMGKANRRDRKQICGCLVGVKGGGRMQRRKKEVLGVMKMFYRLKRKLLLGLGWWYEKGQKALQESLFWADDTVLLSWETGLSTQALVWANGTNFISVFFRISTRSWQAQDSEEGWEYPVSWALASNGLKYGSL